MVTLVHYSLPVLFFRITGTGERWKVIENKICNNYVSIGIIL